MSVPPERVRALMGAFRERFGRAPDGVAEAPGRVNLIGEHVDYNDGFVLPVAIDRAVRVAYARRSDARFEGHSVDYVQDAAFTRDEAFVRDDERPWSNYVRGVVAVLASEGHAGDGLDLAITGDVPVGAGLSSSAALEVAVLGALRAAWHLELDDPHLAQLAQRAEQDYVGVRCGIMDQLVSVSGVAGHALLIDCRTLAHDAVPLLLDELGLALVVIDSGVERRLDASPYNQRREECGEALALLRRSMGSRPPAALRDVSPGELEAHGGCLPPTLRRRARHVVTEIARVEAAVAALRRGDFEAFGELTAASHASLRDDYEVSCRELDRLVELASAVRGVFGARLTGAGFGGCIVCLARKEAISALESDVVEAYWSETGLAATVHVLRAADGLRVWEGAAA